MWRADKRSVIAQICIYKICINTAITVLVMGRDQMSGSSFLLGPRTKDLGRPGSSLRGISSSRNPYKLGVVVVVVVQVYGGAGPERGSQAL